MPGQDPIRPPDAQPPQKVVPSQGSYGGYGSAYGYADYYGYGQGGQAHDRVMNYVRTLYRRRWAALSAVVVWLLAVGAYTITATPIFEARSQILIQPENPNVISFQEVLQQEKGSNEYYQTQYTILKSRALARRTIDTLKLWNSPPFGGGAARPSGFGLRSAVAGAVRWVGRFLSGAAEQPAPAPTGESDSQSRAIDALLGNLTVSPIRNSRLVDLRFALPDAEMAAAVVNAHAKQYIEQSLEYKFLSTRDAADWLMTQLEEQRKKLEASERALQAYRERGNAVALEDRQNIVVQRLTDLSTAYTRARTIRIEKEALYNQLVSLQASKGALDSFPAILSNSFIQGLKTQLSDLQRQQAQMSERLGENHPDMVKIASAISSTEAKLEGETGKVVQSVRSEFLSAQAQERSLAAELESQKRDALALNATGIEYSVLKREADSNKQIYEALTQRAKETGISGELRTSNIRVVDEAQVPRSPVSPDKRQNLLVGVLGGLLAGLVVAFGLDAVDNRLKNPDEIQTYLGLRFLGIVPGISQGDRPGALLLDAGTPAHFSEAFRSIRTNLVFSSDESGGRSLLVTSSQPGEGKTLVAANLAIALAKSGQRVVLVDCDMRKPRQHDLFGVKSSEGVSGVVAGAAKVSEAIRRTTRSTLWLLPAGPAPTNPSELLGSPRFEHLLKTLGDHFDWLVIDSPPVMAVTDAAVISHQATGVVFVVGSEQTNRPTALRAVRQLQGTKATLLGGILNRVNVQQHPYYYSHYYKHDYASYYSNEGQAGKKA